MIKKRLLLIFFSFLLFSFLFNACSEIVSPEESARENAQLNKKGGNEKVQLCHLTGDGEYILIEVSVNAVDAHLAHGDKLLDVDGDGYTAYDACFGTMDDCDDNDPAVYPGAEEICGDGIDNNCNGEVDENCETACPADYSQGFEEDASGWIQGGIFGSAVRTASSTNEINPSAGNWFALFNGKSPTGPYSSFDGALSSWPGDWTSEIDVYLDPNWEPGEGFNYSVAANGTDGIVQQYFVFHFSKDVSTGKLLVGVSNAPAYSVIQDLENRNHSSVDNSGWFTLQHEFYDNGGQLAVSMSVIDVSGSIIFTQILSYAGDYIPSQVGGNGSAWFTYIDVEGGIAVDEQKLFRNCD